MSAPAASARKSASVQSLLLGAAGVSALVAGAVMLAKSMRARSTRAAPAAPAPALPYALLLFDIEGTTTPISFVKEILFPYVAARLDAYLERTYDSAQTRTDIQALIELAEADLAGGAGDAPQIPRFPGAEEGEVGAEFRSAQVRAAAANARWQMSSDRKSTALKALQGHMWAEGYASGELKGQLYGGAEGDVAVQLRAWAAQGYRLGVYSSGSVGAQRLLFGHSDAGDLNPLFAHNFDTTVGTKQQESSYAAIAAQTGLDASPERILFFTDIFGEAVAARQAGLHVVLLDRPGNYELPAEQIEKGTFPLAKDFYEVQRMMQQKAEGTGPLVQQQQPAAVAAATTTAPAAQVDVSKGQFNTF